MKAIKQFSGILVFSMLVLVILSGCSSSGPRKVLDAAAKALKNKNAVAFAKVVRISTFRATTMGNWVKLMGEAGLQMVARHVTRGVSTGTIVAKCDNSEDSLCPWVPAALKKAKITKVDKDSAVAAVDAGKYKIRTWLGLHKFKGGKWRIVSMAKTKENASQFCSDAYFAKVNAEIEKAKKAEELRKKEEAARAAKLKVEQAEYAKEVAAAKAKADKILDNVTFSGVRVSCSGNASEPVINVHASLTNHAGYPIFPYKVAFEIVDRSGHTVAAYPMVWHRNKPIMPGEKAPLHGIFRASLLGTSPICKYYNELKWGGYSMKLSMAAIKRLDGSYVAQNGYPFVNKIPRPGTY